MVEVERDNGLEAQRQIGILRGTKAGPTLIFFGGIHGNEPSGVQALMKVFGDFENSLERLSGSAFAFAGNLKALAEKKRFLDCDLNRMWTDDIIGRSDEEMKEEQETETLEQRSLLKEIRAILKNETPPFYFFDLHTTSSPSDSFILINDTLSNRKLARAYPSKVILGIEEYLEGPLLSYINDQGYVSLGFEGGQHDDPKAIENHIDFIIQSFLTTGFLSDYDLYKRYITDRKKNKYAHSFYEVRHRYKINEDEEFKMNPGFANFTPIKSREAVAINKYGKIEAVESGYIFMPLYQTKGKEGFFIIKLIPTFWLRFSSFLRKINFDNILLAVPGVKRYSETFKTLSVDGRIARLISRDLFHLLGYRRVRKEGRFLLYIKRESIKSKY